MAEYTTDEERFSALVNFFKDNKNTFLALFSITSISLIFFLSYQSYSSSQNEKAAVIYDAWFSSLASSASDTTNSVDHFNQLQEKYSGTGYAQLARIIRGSSLAKEEQFDSALGLARLCRLVPEPVYKCLDTLALGHLTRVQL